MMRSAAALLCQLHSKIIEADALDTRNRVPTGKGIRLPTAGRVLSAKRNQISLSSDFGM